MPAPASVALDAQAYGLRNGMRFGVVVHLGSPKEGKGTMPLIDRPWRCTAAHCLHHLAFAHPRIFSYFTSIHPIDLDGLLHVCLIGFFW